MTHLYSHSHAKIKPNLAGNNIWGQSRSSDQAAAIWAAAHHNQSLGVDERTLQYLIINCCQRLLEIKVTRQFQSPSNLCQLATATAYLRTTCHNLKLNVMALVSD